MIILVLVSKSSPRSTASLQRMLVFVPHRPPAALLKLVFEELGYRAVVFRNLSISFCSASSMVPALRRSLLHLEEEKWLLIS